MSAQQAIDQALRDAEFDPRALEQVEERLFALRGASRKYATLRRQSAHAGGEIRG